jgi:tRNA/tmRNA/rRNA uracil-C5-methylase (TrmA/RlmC/RlmD family)
MGGLRCRRTLTLESLARDLAALHGDDAVEALQLCDLFPHTEHVEALSLLRRR